MNADGVAEFIPEVAHATDAAHLVSVLTPSFNQARWLHDNLESVATQTYPAIEHIVMDGGSTDESVDILSHANPGVVWRSESDGGQSDAINKAFHQSTGSIIGWLNSDDAYFSRSVVADAVRVFEEHPDVGVVYGHAALVNASGTLLQVLWTPSIASAWLRVHNLISQPTVFIRRSAIGRPYFVDPAFDYSMDRELWLYLSRRTRFRRMDRIVAIDRHHMGRKSYTRLDLAAHDRDLMAERYRLPGIATNVLLHKSVNVGVRLAGLSKIREAGRAGDALPLDSSAKWIALRQIAQLRRWMPSDSDGLSAAREDGAHPSEEPPGLGLDIMESSVTPVEARGTSTVEMATVVLCQTAIGDYRQAFLDVLVERLGPRLIVYSGGDYFDGTTQTNVQIGHVLRPIRNRFLLRRRLLWQSGAVKPMVQAGVAILEFNPRIISTWAVLVTRRALNRPSLLWGHAWSRSGRRSRTEPLRKAMRRLANGLVVYTASQAAELKAADSHVPVFVAPNALYRTALMQPLDVASPPNSFIYVGRLVDAKKPQLMLDAFVDAIPALPVGARLIVVGQGPLLETLRQKVSGIPEVAQIEFHGHVSDTAELRRLYSMAIASVSPGFVGLSITQSLGFGVPMIISRDEPHSPELEAAREGWNARTYHPSTARALAKALIEMSSAREAWFSRRDDISLDCRTRYSAEAMAEGMFDAVQAVERSR